MMTRDEFALWEQRVGGPEAAAAILPAQTLRALRKGRRIDNERMVGLAMVASAIGAEPWPSKRTPKVIASFVADKERAEATVVDLGRQLAEAKARIAALEAAGSALKAGQKPAAPSPAKA